MHGMSNTQPTQATASPPTLTPGAILASPQGRGTITIVSTEPALMVLLNDRLYTWCRRTSLAALARMEFAVVGHEPADVLAKRVLLAEANYRARVAA